VSSMRREDDKPNPMRYSIIDEILCYMAAMAINDKQSRR
jgi:hypothetical protein